jgi:hypothetical protein
MSRIFKIQSILTNVLRPVEARDTQHRRSSLTKYEATQKTSDGVCKSWLSRHRSVEERGRDCKSARVPLNCGKLSFAVKKCVPDCANAVRDLCGHLESPGEVVLSVT